MADFCAACSMQTFGRDTGDLKGLTPYSRWVFGEAAQVLCEGCGSIQVDPHGNCASPDCLEKGKPGHGVPWATHKPVTEADVLAFMQSLDAQGTPWANGCTALIANLWLHNKSALEKARASNGRMQRTPAKALIALIVRTQKALEGEITFALPPAEEK